MPFHPSRRRGSSGAAGLGAVAVELEPQVGKLLARRARRHRQEVDPFLSDVAARVHDEPWIHGDRGRGFDRAGVEPRQNDGRPAVALRDEPFSVHSRDAVRGVGNPNAGSLHGPPDRPDHPTPVSAPVRLGPYLDPVDDEPVAPAPAQRARRGESGSRGTTQCGRRRSGSRGARDAAPLPGRSGSGEGASGARRCRRDLRRRRR